MRGISSSRNVTQISNHSITMMRGRSVTPSRTNTSTRSINSVLSTDSDLKSRSKSKSPFIRRNSIGPNNSPTSSPLRSPRTTSNSTNFDSQPVSPRGIIPRQSSTFSREAKSSMSSSMPLSSSQSNENERLGRSPSNKNLQGLSKMEILQVSGKESSMQSFFPSSGRTNSKTPEPAMSRRQSLSNTGNSIRNGIDDGGSNNNNNNININSSNNIPQLKSTRRSSMAIKPKSDIGTFATTITVPSELLSRKSLQPLDLSKKMDGMSDQIEDNITSSVNTEVRMNIPVVASVRNNIRTKNNSGDFVGVKEFSKKLINQVKKFEQWSMSRNWKKFHTSHFDYWVFPLGDRTNFGLRYSVFEEEVFQLRKDKNFMRSYIRGIELVALAWGWNIKTDGFIPKPDIKRGQTWSNWPIRLYRAHKSTVYLGLLKQSESLQKYADILLDQGYPFIYNQYDLKPYFRPTKQGVLMELDDMEVKSDNSDDLEEAYSTGLQLGTIYPLQEDFSESNAARSDETAFNIFSSNKSLFITSDQNITQEEEEIVDEVEEIEESEVEMEEPEPEPEGKNRRSFELRHVEPEVDMADIELHRSISSHSMYDTVSPTTSSKVSRRASVTTTAIEAYVPVVPPLHYIPHEVFAKQVSIEITPRVQWMTEESNRDSTSSSSLFYDVSARSSASYSDGYTLRRQVNIEEVTEHEVQEEHDDLIDAYNSGHPSTTIVNTSNTDTTSPAQTTIQTKESSSIPSNEEKISKDIKQSTSKSTVEDSVGLTPTRFLLTSPDGTYIISKQVNKNNSSDTKLQSHSQSLIHDKVQESIPQSLSTDPSSSKSNGIAISSLKNKLDSTSFDIPSEETKTMAALDLIENDIREYIQNQSKIDMDKNSDTDSIVAKEVDRVLADFPLDLGFDTIDFSMLSDAELHEFIQNNSSNSDSNPDTSRTINFTTSLADELVSLDSSRRDSITSNDNQSIGYHTDDEKLSPMKSNNNGNNPNKPKDQKHINSYIKDNIHSRNFKESGSKGKNHSAHIDSDHNQSRPPTHPVVPPLPIPGIRSIQDTKNKALLTGSSSDSARSNSSQGQHQQQQKLSSRELAIVNAKPTFDMKAVDVKRNAPLVTTTTTPERLNGPLSRSSPPFSTNSSIKPVSNSTAATSNNSTTNTTRKESPSVKYRSNMDSKKKDNIATTGKSSVALIDGQNITKESSRSSSRSSNDKDKYINTSAESIATNKVSKSKDHVDIASSSTMEIKNSDIPTYKIKDVVIIDDLLDSNDSNQMSSEDKNWKIDVSKQNYSKSPRNNMESIVILEINKEDNEEEEEEEENEEDKDSSDEISPRGRSDTMIIRDRAFTVTGGVNYSHEHVETKMQRRYSISADPLEAYVFEKKLTREEWINTTDIIHENEFPSPRSDTTNSSMRSKTSNPNSPRKIGLETPITTNKKVDSSESKTGSPSSAGSENISQPFDDFSSLDSVHSKEQSKSTSSTEPKTIKASAKTTATHDDLDFGTPIVFEDEKLIGTELERKIIEDVILSSPKAKKNKAIDTVSNGCKCVIS